MNDFTRFLALPATLLAFITTTEAYAQERKWPYNIPPTVKYFPEHESQVRLDLEAQQKLAWLSPVGIKKMSDDEGEKFFPHYWSFGESSASTSSNTTLLPPIAPHTSNDYLPSKAPRRSIFARDYKCPAGTDSCSNLKSDLCCPSDQTCVSTSNGIGCCPSGESCGGSIGGCDTNQGYTSCPNSLSGGCCVPGAICKESGCVLYGTQTVTVNGVVSTITAGQSSSTAPQTTTNVIPTPSGYTTTVTVTQSLSGQLTTVVSTLVSATTVTKESTCTSGFQSCPASLGGGCCKHGQICGSSTSCLDASTTSSSASVSPPIQPTSVSAATVSSQTQQTTNTMCPTGFYMCSAYYLGGCCRVGRNCDTTSCPSSESTAVLNSGPTVVVPVTSGNAGPTGKSCANGWASCGASVGGGCCPSDHVCGTATCTATVSGQSNTPKQTGSGANAVRWAWGFMSLALGAGVGMIIL